jgi:flagellar motor switch protein FliG
MGANSGREKALQERIEITTTRGYAKRYAMRFRLFLAVFWLLAGFFPVPAASFGGTATPDPQVMDQENGLRREAEGKIQNEILNRILGEGRATVLVNVEVSLESQRKESASSEGKVEDNKGLGDQDYILPWVPAPKTVNKANEVPKDAKMESASGETASASVRQIVSRFDVTVIHDDSVGKDQLKLVEEAIRSAYDRFERVLRIILKPTKFAKFEMKEKIKEGFWDFLKPQYLLPGLVSLLLFLFLFGFVVPFLKALLKAMGNRKASDVFSDTKMSMQGENKNEDEDDKEKTEEELAQEELEMMRKQEEEKFVPFAFIDEKNVERLTCLIHREAPETIAIILSYLKPEFVRQVLMALGPALQAKVAMQMAAVKQTTEAEIRALDADVKKKIDFLVGGLPSLLKVLDDVGHTARENILEYLKNERPNLYEKVRRQILLFDDIVKFPDDALEVVVRELRSENLARALQGASPELRDKIFKNMSKGAAALLKEEMEFGRALTDEQVQEERQKILATIKTLEAAGRIKFRDKPTDDFLDTEDLDLMGGGLSRLMEKSSPAAAPAADPVQAREYAAAGSQMYTEGRYPEALSYLQYAAQLDGNSWEIQQLLGNAFYAVSQFPEALAAFERAVALNPQDAALREWVDQFRAQVSAPAR